jgi:hypothetical protein
MYSEVTISIVYEYAYEYVYEQVVAHFGCGLPAL